MEEQEFVIDRLANGERFETLCEKYPHVNDDETVMMAAIYQTPENFQYASERLRASTEFILANIDRGASGEALLQYAKPNVFYDERILYGLNVDEFVQLYPTFGENLRSKTEVAQIALVGKNYARNLRFIPNHLWEDEVFALRAVLTQGELLTHVPQLSAKYWCVPEFWWAAIRTNGLVLRDALYEYREDYEYVLEAVKQNGKALKYAALPLRDNEQIVKTAIANEPMAWRYATERVQRLLAIHQ